MTQNQFLPEQVLIPFFGNDPIVGVEIGTLGGSGTVAMLNRMPNLKLYTIDPWMHFDGKSFEAERDQEYHDTNYKETLKRLDEFGTRAVVLRMTSDEAVTEIGELIDFVWIDGDHSEDQVRRDIQNWKLKLNSKSILGGHDYQINYIKRIVGEELGTPNLGEDFTWWFEYNG
jgi:hypothetical protein